MSIPMNFMCGRYTITTKEDLLEERFNAEFEVNFVPRYNASPSQNLPVILNIEPQKIQMIKWGLQPSWLKKATGKDGLINVRSESLISKPTFKKDLEQRRCLILADGFYEWKATKVGKQPYRFTLEDEKPFAMAGIWEENHDESGKKFKTFAIVTTEPSNFVTAIHHRMPVMLSPKDEKTWLSEKVKDPRGLLVTFTDKLNVYPVSRELNRAANDNPRLIAPTNDKF